MANELYEFNRQLNEIFDELQELAESNVELIQENGRLKTDLEFFLSFSQDLMTERNEALQRAEIAEERLKAYTEPFKIQYPQTDYFITWTDASDPRLHQE